MPHPERFKTNLNLARMSAAAKETVKKASASAAANAAAAAAAARATALKKASMATHPRGPLPPRIGSGSTRRNSRKSRKQTRRNRH
jgi:hypothetical protein